MESKKFFIVRCDRSGVFFGEIAERNGREVTMRNARKLWAWYGACAVEQLAVDGTKQPNDCKFTVTVPEIVVTDAIQSLPCTEKAAKSISGVREWKR